MVVVQLLGLSGRVLAAQARGVLGLTLVIAGLFTFIYFHLIISKFLYFQREARYSEKMIGCVRQDTLRK